MGIFGKQASPEKDNLNVFGEPSKTQEKEEEANVQQTSEEREPEEQVETSSEETGESVEEQPTTDKEKKTEDIEEPQGIETKDKSKLAGKFDNRVSLIDGISNLGEKLGREVDPAKVQGTDTKELVEVYKELEEELGNTSDIDQTRKVNQNLKEQNEQYKQELNSMKQELNRINQYLNKVQMPQQNPQPNFQTNPNQGQSQPQRGITRDPKTGRFVSNNQQQTQPTQNNQPQQNQDNQNQDNQTEDIDPDEWLRDFYKNPIEAVQKINNMNNQKQQEIKQNMNQKQKQDYRAQQEKMRQQQSRRYKEYITKKQNKSFAKQSNRLKDKYGEDFDNPETKKAILRFVNKHPLYLNPDIMPDGIERVYMQVRGQSNMPQKNSEEGNNIKNNISVEEKKSASLPKSKGSNIKSNSPNEKNQAIKDNIFKNNTGLFKT